MPTSSREPTLLIVAHSGRMLAASARRGGYLPLVVDRFADADTRELARDWIQVAEFSPELVFAAAKTLIRRYRPCGWLYGAGTDSHPDLVAALAELCPLYGNFPETLRCCVEPRRFFVLLDRLQIPYPTVRWNEPEEPGWLLKQGGCGGMGVRLWDGKESCGTGYFQRRLFGPVFTLMFLAVEGRLSWYGFNTLCYRAYNKALPFLFAGAVNRARLPRRLADRVVAMAACLAEALNLRGLHGLDFMVAESGPMVLELNPRPGAALTLWDQAWSTGGVVAHVDACWGCQVLPDRQVSVSGMRVVYASRPFRVSSSWRWPPWCCDRPVTGTVIAAGEPFCTVRAVAARLETVEWLLMRRQQWIERRMDHFKIEVRAE